LTKPGRRYRTEQGCERDEVVVSIVYNITIYQGGGPARINVVPRGDDHCLTKLAAPEILFSSSLLIVLALTSLDLPSSLDSPPSLSALADVITNPNHLLEWMSLQLRRPLRSFKWAGPYLKASRCLIGVSADSR
jgi:hypothetical protein